ncbi:MAG: aminotransferase class V-fold PLP-dependent enzyme [Lachnospiraceae bacterium]|nr:aminotransferase class V-fold PLP-dependent enzyme [Lachnospiraceae bacterium]
MGELFDRIDELSGNGKYPFHMPGHKRNALLYGREPSSDSEAFFSEWYKRDITEIPGSDDLHDPSGIILDAMKRASDLYGADRSYFLINGSTSGNLVAVSAAVKPGGRILAMRSSHQSFYHAVMLRRLDVVYLDEETDEEIGAAYGIRAETVEKALDENEGIEAVFITSPTYEGFSSEIAKIADAAHKRGVPLIVDAAHGAHFGFSSYFPRNAVNEGADIAVMSLHKTLPAPTQTAILHLTGGLVPRDKVEQFLQVYQSTSPSYLLLAAIDDCIGLTAHISENAGRAYSGAGLWERFYENRRKLSEFFEKNPLENIGIYDYFTQKQNGGLTRIPEPGKMMIVSSDRLSGRRLSDYLLKECGIVAEMSVPEYVLLIFTVMDTDEGYERLKRALIKADSDADLWQIGTERSPVKCAFACDNKAAIPIWKASEMEKRPVGYREAEGLISAEMVTVYPPGRPLFVPGEIMTADKLSYLEKAALQGCEIRGKLSAVVE